MKAANAAIQDGRRSVVLLYENEAWNLGLAEALRERGLCVRCVDLRSHAFDLQGRFEGAVYFNRLSPSAALRGNDDALDLGRVLVRKLELDGHRVVNGTEAFDHELDKLRQYLLLSRLGLAVPRTLALSAGAREVDLSTLPFPAILKPNTGGSGSGVTVVNSPAEALAGVEAAGRSDGSWLLQERIVPADGRVLRLELIGGRLVYAMRVRAVNTFNLCPAEACERPPANAADATAPRAVFEHEPDPDPALVHAARDVLSAIGLEVGGVEILVEASGRAVFLDVNATSVYRDDVAAAAGVDPYAMLANHLVPATTSAATAVA
ncbi:MAG: hypothetical protein AAF682_18340 [Planctomycetota bacterium]